MDADGQAGIDSDKCQIHMEERAEQRHRKHRLLSSPARSECFIKKKKHQIDFFRNPNINGSAGKISNITIYDFHLIFIVVIVSQSLWEAFKIIIKRKAQLSLSNG